MIELFVDGRRVKAEEGETLLVAARRAGIEVPTLCYHDALEAWGGCRLCVVEITHADWGGWKGLVTACLYPVSQGLEVDTGVETGNERVFAARKNVLDLLLARCPASDVIREMAREYGVEKTSYTESDLDTTCILCTLCVRVCEEIGACAISTSGRGHEKRIAPPFDIAAEACIGCFSCVHICPTDAIEFEETDVLRKIWGREFRMVHCEDCGRPLMTEEHREYEAKNGLLHPLSGLQPDADGRADPGDVPELRWEPCRRR
jgi:NADH dehydrogenase/NADH:ubiquinone oxidoreductase subunit G